VKVRLAVTVSYVDDGCRQEWTGEGIAVQLETAGDGATEAGVVHQCIEDEWRLGAWLTHGQTTPGY